MDEKEIIEIIKESFTINSICKKVYGYSNKGTIEKIKKIIDKYELNIDHFCRGKNNRKYGVSDNMIRKWIENIIKYENR